MVGTARIFLVHPGWVMISLNVPNVLTIAIISLLAVGVAKAGFSYLGWNTNWL